MSHEEWQRLGGEKFCLFVFHSLAYLPLTCTPHPLPVFVFLLATVNLTLTINTFKKGKKTATQSTSSTSFHFEHSISVSSTSSFFISSYQVNVSEGWWGLSVEENIQRRRHTWLIQTTPQKSKQSKQNLCVCVCVCRSKRFSSLFVDALRLSGRGGLSKWDCIAGKAGETLHIRACTRTNTETDVVPVTYANDN